MGQELLDGQVRKVEEDGANVEDLPEDGEPDAEVVARERISGGYDRVGSRGMGRLRRPIGASPAASWLMPTVLCSW